MPCALRPSPLGHCPSPVQASGPATPLLGSPLCLPGLGSVYPRGAWEQLQGAESTPFAPRRDNARAGRVPTLWVGLPGRLLAETHRYTVTTTTPPAAAEIFGAVRG